MEGEGCGWYVNESKLEIRSIKIDRGAFFCGSPDVSSCCPIPWGQRQVQFSLQDTKKDFCARNSTRWID